MKRLAMILLLVAAPAHADLEPGRWEITARTEGQGAPDSKAFTQQHCLTRETAGDPGTLFGSGDTGCEFVNKTDTGSIIRFEVVCATQPPVRGTGRVQYFPQSLEGDLELNMEGVVARSHISGRRLGGC